MTDATSTHAGRFRDLRHDIERAVLPLATSVDGWSFSFQASLHGLHFPIGGYVALEDGATALLGQVLTLEVAHRDSGEVATSPTDDIAGPQRVSIATPRSRSASCATPTCSRPASMPVALTGTPSSAASPVRARLTRWA